MIISQHPKSRFVSNSINQNLLEFVSLLFFENKVGFDQDVKVISNSKTLSNEILFFFYCYCLEVDHNQSNITCLSHSEMTPRCPKYRQGRAQSI